MNKNGSEDMKQIDYYIKCLNRDGSVDYIGGTEKNESLAIKKMKMVIDDNKGRVFEAYFIDKNGNIIFMSPTSGKVKRK